MKLGLLGGTFNPIHNGHLLLANESFHAFSLDKVIFMPVNIPPHKTMAPGASSGDRLKMIKIALEGHDGFEVSTYELEKQGKSFTVDTLRYLKNTYKPVPQIFFLSGSDALPDIETWKDIDLILDECTFVAARRPGFEPESYHFKDKIKLLDIPKMDISSSMIRDRIRSGLSVDAMVPGSIPEYIASKKLYL